MSAAGASTAPPGTLRLEVLAGNAAGTTLDVGERLVFGRQTEGPGQLADDPELSRHHAEITRLPTGEYQLEDLASTNGTSVNGARLQAPVVLSLGDTIELGTTRLMVRALPPAIDVRAATMVGNVPTPPPPAPPQPTPPPPSPTPPPPPPATPEPTPPPPPPPPPPPQPPLELRLKVDLERSEAEIALDRGQSVRFRLQDGCWQIVDGDPR
ncbi:MAG: FHA domain-containing protein [Solirubrobacteraceae bacterium]